MRSRDIVIFTAIFVFLTGFTAKVVSLQLTGSSFPYLTANHAGLSLHRQRCTNTPIPVRPSTNDPQLKALAEYEQACRSAFASDLMLFTDMPVTTTEALQAADTMSARLKEFSAWHVTPIVVVEPDSSIGLLSFHTYASGAYDTWNADYFSRLKADGVTGSEMGIWIPFPEPQQPTWRGNSNPDDFAKSVNRYFGIEKQYFPQAKTAILLDSQVNRESLSQVLAYTRLIKNSLVDIAGLQGFPWYPSDVGDPRAPITSASVFAPASMLEQIARSIGTKTVLINTGTFRQKILSDGSELAVPNAQREATITSIMKQVQMLQKDHYSVTVNIFAQNKLADSEATNWSYWQQGDYDLSPATAIFTNFVNRLHSDHVAISIFDSRK